jgi:hypothetical protein
VNQTRASQFVPLRPQPRRSSWTLRVSALGLSVLFAVIAYGGANILAVERLERWVRSHPGQPIENMLGPVSTWKNTNGVATRARSLALDIILAKTPGDTAAIENALDEVAKASPTSVAAWQARVAFQQARGAPMERVLAAFRMSALTGSHEGYFMMQRANFGLEHWTELPEVDRRTVVRDLVGSATDFGTDSYRKIVAGKSQAEGDDIRAAVTASGPATKALLQALGM